MLFCDNEINPYKLYHHSQQDFLDDITFIIEFTNAFENKIKPLLELQVSFNVFNEKEQAYCIPCYEYGAETKYFTECKIKKIMELITISTEINPFGIRNDLVGRTYTISYNKYELDKDNSIIKKFYAYSAFQFDDVLEKFDSFIKGYAY